MFEMIGLTVTVYIYPLMPCRKQAKIRVTKITMLLVIIYLIKFMTVRYQKFYFSEQKDYQNW